LRRGGERRGGKGWERGSGKVYEGSRTLARETKGRGSGQQSIEAKVVVTTGGLKRGAREAGHGRVGSVECAERRSYKIELEGDVGNKDRLG